MPKPPDAMTRTQLAQSVIARLQAIQEQGVQLLLIQAANDHEETDPVPGSDPKQEDGRIVYEMGEPVYPTYAEEYARLDGAAARVRAKAQELGAGSLVDRLLEAGRAAEDN